MSVQTEHFISGHLMCGDFYRHQSSSLRHQLGILQFNSILTLLEDSIRFHRTPGFCKTGVEIFVVWCVFTTGKRAWDRHTTFYSGFTSLHFRQWCARLPISPDRRALSAVEAERIYDLWCFSCCVSETSLKGRKCLCYSSSGGQGLPDPLRNLADTGRAEKSVQEDEETQPD
ncbi:hypothetical protein PRBEI_2000506800 [Prionailurus iriomotensis]